MLISKFFPIGSGIIGLGSLGTAATYQATVKTIEDESKKVCLPLEVGDEIWKKAYDKWNQAESKLEPFGASVAKTQYQFKNKCKEFYSTIFKSIFHTEKNELLKATKEYCTLEIKDAIAKEKIIKDGDTSKENDFQNQLTEFKKTNYSKTKDWNGLKEWCDRKYKDKYLGEDNNWKEIVKFCVKK